CMIWHNNAYIV
nr:immunoglobulin light chain junction region [Macaca mulatta]